MREMFTFSIVVSLASGTWTDFAVVYILWAVSWFTPKTGSSSFQSEIDTNGSIQK
jgi:uncharacterized membrane protein